MPKTHRKRIISVIALLLLSFFHKNVMAQDVTVPSVNLITFIGDLEEKYSIKFSYVDEDIKEIQINIPKDENLKEVLSYVQYQTQIIIQKLSDRYYTLTKSTTVDICAVVLDNFKENTVIGSSVEVLGSSIAAVTDHNGHFSFDNIPRKAIVQIKHIGFKPFLLRQKI